MEQRSACAAGEVSNARSQIEMTMAWGFLTKSFICVDWMVTVLCLQSFKTKLMELTRKPRRREASKPFFPSLRGVAFPLQHVKRTHTC